YLPVTQGVAGSSPVRSANIYTLESNSFKVRKNRITERDAVFLFSPSSQYHPHSQTSPYLAH
ncbi:hypothetical protein, partial [Atlantibacter sp.]|uniref:hypothetical protein n=1 Tax=Atlantibacter sp. TaxID=1903473 RepID=UPI00289C9523